MIDKRIILFSAVIFLLGMSMVSAAIVTMKVDSKRIEGMDNAMYIISERTTNGYYSYIVQEYPVSIQDYSKVKVEDTVTLEIPEYRTDGYKIVKIN